MNEHDHESFEAELRRLAPARPPAEFMERLAASTRPRLAPLSQASPVNCQPDWWRLLLRWLAPAGAIAAAAAALLAWWWFGVGSDGHGKPAAILQTAGTNPALKADDVEIDERLVASFDAVARLPSGESVRFRCREWADALVLRDSASGIVVEQRAPRLEVVPVSFETY